MASLPAYMIRNFHAKISRRFHDGRLLSQLVEELVSGETRADDVEMLGFKMDGKFWSLNNRTLYCLKEYQATVASRSCERNHHV